MLKAKIRIGTKLGLSALAGLMLVAGMVGNQAHVNRLTHDLMSQAANSRELQQAALEARIILNELVSTDRDIRLARTPNDVNLVLQHFKDRGGEANAAFDAAIAMAMQDDEKKFLTAARTAFNEYMTTTQEIAAARMYSELACCRLFSTA
jgi:hypothetical protein